jgi:hypothetical protein
MMQLDASYPSKEVFCGNGMSMSSSSPLLTSSPFRTR